MANVILIAMVSLLTAVRPAACRPVPEVVVAPLTGGSVITVGGGVAVQEWKYLFPNFTYEDLAAPAFALLVSINRFDSVERTVGGHWALALMEREADPSFCAAGNPGAHSGKTYEWRWDRIAVLNTGVLTAGQPLRAHRRYARGGKFWPRSRRSQGAQVWLTRKQP